MGTRDCAHECCSRTHARARPQVLLSQATTEDMSTLARSLLPLSAVYSARPDAKAEYDKRIGGLCAAFTKLPSLPDLPRDQQWFDSRDFVYLCRQLHEASAAAGRAGVFDSGMLSRALGRNFQCIGSDAYGALVRLFFREVGLARPEHACAPATLEHLRTALRAEARPEQAANAPFRHILLVDRTGTEVALDGLLRRLRAEAPGGVVVVSLSEFAEDGEMSRQTECLAQIQTAVQLGRVIVIVNSLPLQSSLYALLNRHYLLMPRHGARAAGAAAADGTLPPPPPGAAAAGGGGDGGGGGGGGGGGASSAGDAGGYDACVTMAIGAISRSVRVHKDTRIIVHLPLASVPSTPLPFLNRFER
jgi:hypothetical protein